MGERDAVAREDAVLVGFAEGVVAGVEVFGNLLDGERRGRSGEEGAVKGAMEVDGGDGYAEGEGGDLGEGVDAGIGAAGALTGRTVSPVTWWIARARVPWTVGEVGLGSANRCRGLTS